MQGKISQVQYLDPKQGVNLLNSLPRQNCKFKQKASVFDRYYASILIPIKIAEVAYGQLNN